MFQLRSAYQPTGDQPDAIRQLVDGVRAGAEAQTLLGVTGSGKTFTIANVISEINRPTLILSHNKTLAAQLYSEMRQFFPNNAVEYFVSYYDYYQPEAYIPTTDTYIEKDLSINEEIDRLRLSAISALLSGRKDVIVVSSVSCLYGIGRIISLIVIPPVIVNIQIISLKPQKFLSRVRLPAQNLRRIGFGLELRSKVARSPLVTGCKLAPCSDTFESSLIYCIY